MLYHILVPQDEGELTCSGLVAMGMPITLLWKDEGKVGLCNRPIGTYEFFKKGRIFGHYKLPFFSIGEEIHIWKIGAEMKDRIRWEIIDFDPKQILLRRIENGSTYDTHGTHQISERTDQ